MKLVRTLVITGSLLTIVWISWTCKDDVSGGDSGVIVFPDSNVSYMNQVQPLFDRGCGGQSSQCHGSETFAGRGFSLDSYDGLMFGQRTVVIRSQPDASALVLSIEGKSGSKMPPQGFLPINDNQTKGIRQWVKEGAQNN